MKTSLSISMQITAPMPGAERSQQRLFLSRRRLFLSRRQFSHTNLGLLILRGGTEL